MGWFSPVKGSYPSLAQVDKTLPVKKGVTGIQRGMIVALEAGSNDKDEKEGVWKLPTSTDKLLYVALQDYTDPTAGFAGSSFDPKGDGTPRITALDLAQDAEYETSVFDTDQDYSVGQELYVRADGIITSVNGGGEVIGYVTSPKTSRWINNAIAVNPNETDQRLAIRTGATKTVIRFKTK